MRSPLVTVFHETLGSCFASTLKDMLGSAVCESVYGLLERNGILGERFATDLMTPSWC